MKNIKYPYAPALVWGIFIFILSVWPGKDFPTLPDWGDLLAVDKLIHMLFYGLLTWLILHSKRQNTEGVVSMSFAVGIVAFSSGYGWFLEWFQGRFCQGRFSDAMDGIANTIGAVVGLLIFLFLFRKQQPIDDLS
ncbi:MAG: VanZ family protein [Saprospiraceae bacterium]|nr:VanZ family protein [Saprospiraceae bacterium]